MESNAFSRIAEENMQGLYRLSFSILHTRHDAQDAVQQGLLRAWERRETARPEQIRAWLTRIVINECHNIQRKRMRVVLMGEMPEMAAPEDTYEAGDDREKSAFSRKARGARQVRRGGDV